MTRLCYALFATFVISGGATGQDRPPPGFFVGEYEATGRMSGASGQPFADWIRIDDDLNMTACRLGTGKLDYTTDQREGAAPLEGTLGPEYLHCRYQSDGNNYPRLTCLIAPEGGVIPGLITMWPARWPRPTHAKACP